MSRVYIHISDYEKEIIELRKQGYTYKRIAAALGFTESKVKDFMRRRRRKQEALNAGKVISSKGRPCKNADGGLPPSIQKLDKLAQMRYVMASKDRYIKRLEMENELMRDFLSRTERM